uniref:Uncharacterized protein n=2 Tax=Loa loa TaxID=7209 RepID=A0A1I7VV03_LOALO
MSESGSLGTSSTGSDATTDPFSQLLASMARPIPCVTVSSNSSTSSSSNKYEMKEGDGNGDSRGRDRDMRKQMKSYI